MTPRDVAVVVGTRPEIIKMAPVLHALGDRALLVHTGQHYDDSLSGQYLRDLGLPAPDVQLSIRGENRGAQVGAMIQDLTATVNDRSPRCVLVQGDTNTVSAAAQAAHYAGIPVGHVEAGLRSYDRTMPEEVNRQVVGALADVHFAPTGRSRDNLLREGVPADRILVTGNTIVEATHTALAAMGRPSLKCLLDGRHLPARFIVATVHRPENTDDRAALLRVLTALAALPLPVIFFVHPRTRAAIDRFGLHQLTAGLILAPPPPHGVFLVVARAAALIVTDSGGVQEEATVLRTPLVIVRKNTERPETIAMGLGVLAPPDQDIAEAVQIVLSRNRKSLKAGNPFGDGRASERIAAVAMDLAAGVPPQEAVGATRSWSGIA